VHVIRGDLDAAVRQRLCLQPRRYARQFQYVDGPLLQDPGANATEDVLGRALFENHSVDACPVEQLSEQQPRRSRADDGHLCSHERHAGRHRGGWRWRKASTSWTFPKRNPTRPE
jgi:hypothetical protein